MSNFPSGTTRQYSYNSNVTTTPSAGFVSFNNANPQLATLMYVNKIDSTSVDITQLLLAIYGNTSGSLGSITVTNFSTPSIFYQFNITGRGSLTNPVSSIPISFVSRNGTFTSNLALNVNLNTTALLPDYACSLGEGNMKVCSTSFDSNPSNSSRATDFINTLFGTLSLGTTSTTAAIFMGSSSQTITINGQSLNLNSSSIVSQPITFMNLQNESTANYADNLLYIDPLSGLIKKGNNYDKLIQTRSSTEGNMVAFNGTQMGMSSLIRTVGTSIILGTGSTPITVQGTLSIANLTVTGTGTVGTLNANTLNSTNSSIGTGTGTSLSLSGSFSAGSASLSGLTVTGSSGFNTVTSSDIKTTTFTSSSVSSTIANLNSLNTTNGTISTLNSNTSNLGNARSTSLLVTGTSITFQNLPVSQTSNILYINNGVVTQGSVPGINIGSSEGFLATTNGTTISKSSMIQTISAQSLVQIGSNTSSVDLAVYGNFVATDSSIFNNTLQVDGVLFANAGIISTTGSFSGLLSANGGMSSTTANFSGLLTANAGISATSVSLSSSLTCVGFSGTTGTFSGLLTASNGISSTTGLFSGLITANGGISGTTGSFSGSMSCVGLSGTTGTFSGLLTASAGISSTSISLTSSLTCAGFSGTTGTFSGLLTANAAISSTSISLSSSLTCVGFSGTTGTFSGLLTANGDISSTSATFSSSVSASGLSSSTLTVSGLVTAQSDVRLTGIPTTGVTTGLSMIYIDPSNNSRLLSGPIPTSGITLTNGEGYLLTTTGGNSINKSQVIQSSSSLVTIGPTTTVDFGVSGNSAFVGNVIVGNDLQVVKSMEVGPATATETRTLVINLTGLTSFTPPPNTTSMTIKCWGAGGNSNGSLGGLGGGGAYSTVTINSPSGTYYAVVGSCGSGTSIIMAGNANGGGGTGVFTLSAGNYTAAVVAGGGGGGGFGASATNGANGGASGTAGSNVNGSVTGGQPGNAGTGGAGGTSSGVSAGTTGNNFGGTITNLITDTSGYGGSGSGGNGGSGGGGYGGGGGGGSQTSTISAGGGGGGSLGTTIINGSGTTPGNNGDSNYISGYAGGATTANGTGQQGFIVVIFTVTGSNYLQISSSNLVCRQRNYSYHLNNLMLPLNGVGGTPLSTIPTATTAIPLFDTEIASDKITQNGNGTWTLSTAGWYDIEMCLTLNANMSGTGSNQVYLYFLNSLDPVSVFNGYIGYTTGIQLFCKTSVYCPSNNAIITPVIVNSTGSSIKLAGTTATNYLKMKLTGAI